MPGIEPLKRLQLGREVTAGTPVAATTIWNGLVGTPQDDRVTEFPDQNIGMISPTDRSHVTKLASSLTMPSTELTFEQFPHICEAGIKVIGTGAADGVGSGKIYNYTLPTTAKNTIKTYTLEGGDDQQAEELEYSFVKEFSITGNAGESLKLDSCKWQARQSTLTTFTGALSVPTVEDVMASKGKVYLDNVGGTFGTTLKSNTFLSISAKIVTGWVEKFTISGDLFFSFAKLVRPSIEVDLVFEHDATAVAEIANWRSQTARLLQLKWEGSALTTPGTTYSYKTLIFNLVGKWSKFSPIEADEGNSIVTGTFVSKYNSTQAVWGSIIVVNELATIP